jgi:AcrR family transcriptional regulator
MSTPRTVSARTTRRERRHQQMRRAIQLAALRLTAERGFDQVTVQAISDAVNIAPRTFFTYFTSKDEAIGFTHLWTAERLEAALSSCPPDQAPLMCLRTVMKAMAADITADTESMQLFRDVVHRAPGLVQRLLGTDEDRVQALARAIASRINSATMYGYPLVSAWAAWGAGQAAVHQWLEQQATDANAGEARSVEHLIDDAFDLLEHGLAPR